MLDPAFAPIAAIGWLQAKHLVCDFFLQTSHQVQNKGTYGHPGGLAHAGIHIVGSVPIFVIYPVSLGIGLLLLALEFLAHYHIDWLKNAVTRRYGWTTEDRQYWWAIGTDQFAHQLTYLLLVLALALLDGR